MMAGTRFVARRLPVDVFICTRHARFTRVDVGLVCHDLRRVIFVSVHACNSSDAACVQW